MGINQPLVSSQCEVDSSITSSAPEISINEVDSSPFDLRSCSQSAIMSFHHDRCTHPYEEVGRLHLWKGYFEVLNDLDPARFIDTHSFDFRRIGHE